MIDAVVQCTKCGTKGIGNCDCWPDFKKGQSVSLTSDEAKALRQLVACFETYPQATGLSHLVGLLIRDAAKGHNDPA